MWGFFASCLYLISSYLNFAGVYDIKVVTLITLLDNDLSGYGTDWKHGVKDIRPFVFIEMRKKDIFGDGLGQGSHGLEVLWDHLK